MSYLEDRTGLNIEESKKLFENELSPEEVRTITEWYKWRIDSVIDDYANLKTGIETTSLLDVEDARELLHYLSEQLKSGGKKHFKL